MVHSNTIKNSLNDDLSWVNEKTPCFEVDSKNIHIIISPQEFFSNLKDLIIRSNQRVVLSSLYFGNGSLEIDLVDTIQKKISKNKELRVKCLFDYSRGLRGVTNSKKMFENLINLFEKQFSFHLYHSPKLRGNNNLILICLFYIFNRKYLYH
jgi:CDP-diacylglycerol--glycerol-3-phosphate 3-phosphatidyltransferase